MALRRADAKRPPHPSRLSTPVFKFPTPLDSGPVEKRDREKRKVTNPALNVELKAELSYDLRIVPLLWTHLYEILQPAFTSRLT